jgi:pentatricopeptide repeat protein
VEVDGEEECATRLIYWLCKKRMVQEARKLFDELERGFKPSLLTYNSLILGSCENGELQGTGKVWDDMVERRYQPNAMTYEALIKGLCKMGKSNEGASIFQEMVAKGCTPSKLLYHELVNSLSDEDIVCNILEATVLSGQNLLDGECWETFVKNVVNPYEPWSMNLDALLNI